MKRVRKVLLALLMLGLTAVLLNHICSSTGLPLFSQTTVFRTFYHLSATNSPSDLVESNDDSLLLAKLTKSDSLTSVNGPSENNNIFLSLLHDMTRCSLSLGVSKERLDSYQTTLMSLAQKGTLLLTTFKEVLPDDKLLTTHRNPCWKTSSKTLVTKRTLMKSNLSSLMEDSAQCLEPNECIHCLPYFFIPGFPKCGTTSLYFILSQHPQIAPPSRKAIHLWSNVPLRDFRSDYLKARVILYSQYFENASVQPDVITYDGSPSLFIASPFKNDYYCLNAAVVSRMVPNAKFVVIMRNPVDRLYSGYFAFSEDYSKWPASMQQNAALYFHLKAEEAIGQFKDCLSQGNSSYECSTVELRNWMKVKKKNRGNSNVRPSLGIYYIYVLKWIQFYPIENFLFLKTEDMAHNPTAVMKDITEFLRIQSVSEESVKTWFSGQRNSRSTSIEDKYGDMMPKTRKLLTDFYAPHNKQLVELVGDERFLWSQ